MNARLLTSPGPARWIAAGISIGSAFALGCLLSRWAPGSTHKATTPTIPDPHSLTTQALPAPAPPDTSPPLTDADFADAAERMRAALASNTPEHDLLAAAERLLHTARTPDDFLRLVDLLNTVPSDTLIEPIAIAAFTRWAQSDPKAAALGADRIQSHQLKHQLAREVCRIWARRDPKGALDFLESAEPGFARRFGPQVVFSVLAESDPQAALARAREWKNRSERSNLTSSVLQTWAAARPLEALAFARAEPDPRQRAELLQGALSALPKDQAWAEAAAFVDLASPDDRLLLRNILNGWSFQIEAPAAAVLALPAGEARDELLADVAMGAVLSDHKRAEALLDTMPDAPTRETWLAALAHSHLRTADHPRPLDALRLAAELPAGETQSAVFREAGTRWSEHDAPGASQWIATQPAGPNRDAFLGEFVRGTFDTEPEAALTWTVEITDDAKRQRRLAELFPKWQQRDSKAATAWLNRQNLSDADRTSLAAP